ncbi:hydantoinase B/oxoprolinase family protein [Catenovulum sediminis]|uniref:hydantoinase B/oxoprolinase family protein n=1 Tax=Catenovulum sediminis TaxID=1740262 RepID=UPI001FE519FB|nr:hydantoinase B/oxoprolinase family protein [Catenovulum sediminis]
MADSLGMKSVVIHPYAGVLSAFGIGLADQGITKEVSVQKTLSDRTLEEVSILADSLHAEFNKTSLKTRSKDTHLAKPQFNVRLLVKYLGSEVRIELALDEYRLLKRDFETQHMRQFGYLQQNCEIQIDAMVVSLVEPSESNLSAVTVEPIVSSVDKHLPADSQYTIHYRENLSISEIVYGPALIIEKTGTNVLEPGWNAEVLADYSLRFSQTEQLSSELSVTKKQSRKLALDPVQLEIFNNLYMSVAEQMGEILARTAHSVNIRERLDFSCAIFNENGELIANAPHVPVHLGSMSHSVKAIISKVDKISAGDSYLINSPYSGGTHLPDLTLVSPLFIAGIEQPVMYFASRAHHADIGGITPGSMPAASKHINEEGILFDGLKVVENNQLLTQVIDEYFSKGALPARNIAQNIADLAAQQAANIAGQKEMKKILEKYGFSYIQQVTNAILDNGELAVKNALKTLSSGAYQLKMDSGAVVAVDIKINDQQAVIDFSQSSLQQNSNFNAPRSITDAAVIYVFRTLVDKNIPLNAGCMRPLKVIVNKGSMLDPEYPAAVVAGNVEVSQAIVTSLFLALGVQAASQTTMNNLSFGNHAYQYYETLAGGTGAGHNYHGTDAVHSHMTNSRLTDPEVLEQRYPVILRQFAIRQNSGGLGRFNGGNGLTRTIQFNQKMTVNILSNSRIVAPPGLFGGQAGKCGKNMLHTIDGNTTLLAENCELEVKAGESLTIKTPGGGAYGAYENL